MIFTWVTEATARCKEVVVSVEADRPRNWGWGRAGVSFL